MHNDTFSNQTGNSFTHRQLIQWVGFKSVHKFNRNWQKLKINPNRGSDSLPVSTWYTLGWFRFSVFVWSLECYRLRYFLNLELLANIFSNTMFVNSIIKSKWSLSISLDLMLRTSIRKKSCCAIQLADLTSVKFPCGNKLLIACAVLAWNRHINTITECLIAFILASTLKLVASVRYSSIPSFQNELFVSISRFVCCHWLFGGKLIICVIFSIEFNLLRMFRLWKFYSKAYQKPKSIKCWTDFCWSVQRKRAAVKLILNL